jgi:hypothetical protein
MIATSRIVRPQAFGGRHTGLSRPDGPNPATATGPIPTITARDDYESLYPPARPRLRSSSRPYV